VPPLGTRLGDRVVDVALIEAFVGDLLEVSIPQHASATHTESEASGSTGSPADVAEVRNLIDKYFLSWSKRDLERFAECFDPGAMLQFIDRQGGLDTIGLDQFLAGQHAAMARSSERRVERPVDVTVAFSGDVSRVDVHWRLFKDDDVVTGFDHFLLRRSGDAWRIVHLVNYPID